MWPVLYQIADKLSCPLYIVKKSSDIINKRSLMLTLVIVRIESTVGSHSRSSFTNQHTNTNSSHLDWASQTPQQLDLTLF